MKPQEDKRYEIARKRVKEKKKFYEHLTTYLVMSIFFMLLGIFFRGGRGWVLFPILGWGIGVAMHYFQVFGMPGMGPAEDWEERAIQEELRKLGVPPPEEEKTPEPDKPEDQEESLELKELQKKYDERDLV